MSPSMNWTPPSSWTLRDFSRTEAGTALPVTSSIAAGRLRELRTLEGRRAGSCENNWRNYHFITEKYQVYLAYMQHFTLIIWNATPHIWKSMSNESMRYHRHFKGTLTHSWVEWLLSPAHGKAADRTSRQHWPIHMSWVAPPTVLLPRKTSRWHWPIHELSGFSHPPDFALNHSSLLWLVIHHRIVDFEGNQILQHVLLAK